MAGGGFGSGVLNTLIGGGSFSDALNVGANSILPSLAGGLAGQAVGGLASGITINGTNLGSISPMLQGAVAGGLGGLAGGTVSALASGANLGDALSAGLKGGALGLAMGAATRSVQAWDDGIDPLTNKPLNAQTMTTQEMQETSRYAFGLKDKVVDFADEIGAKHLMKEENWKAKFLDVIDNPKNELHFILDGVDSSPMTMMNTPNRSGINWEINKLYQHKTAFERTIFYFGGQTYKGHNVFKLKP